LHTFKGRSDKHNVYRGKVLHFSARTLSITTLSMLGLFATLSINDTQLAIKSAIMLIVPCLIVMLSDVTLSVVMLSVVTPSVVMG